MRERIVTAAADVLRDRGFAETTTKEIARVAGVSEGSIYNHFESKTALIAAAMGEVAGGVRAAIQRLLERVGEGTLEDNLVDLAVAQVEFFRQLLPIAGPTLGSRDLLAWLREGGPGPSAAMPPGPVLGHAGVIAYLEGEQRAGRLLPGALPPYLAAALIGACQQYAFLSLLTRPDVLSAIAQLPAEPAAYARAVVRTLLTAQASVAARHQRAG
jgi:AcrR family transcriptional regulator